MLIVRSVSPGAVSYFADGRHEGTWTPAAERLLGVAGPVDPASLRAVLRGRHPATGAQLPSVSRPRRRPGWDLVFAAPKSISLIAATSRQGAEVVGAHAVAVGQTLEYLESRLTVRRSDGPAGKAPAGGLIGACFLHLSNSASEPHLHSHAVIANLTRTDRGWSAVRNEDWFVGRRSVAAIYQMALRERLRSAGWDLEWRLRPDGLADVAVVPTAAIRATSTQGRLAVSRGRHQARQQATPRRWREAAEVGSWRRSDREAPDRREQRRSARPTPGGMPGGSAGSADDSLFADPRLQARVVSLLATRRSDFSAADVVIALASSHAPGASPTGVAAWVNRFCSTCVPVPSPTEGRRWSTTLAIGADERLQRMLLTMSGRSPTRSATGTPDGPSGLDASTGTARAPSDAGSSRVLVLAAPAGRSSLLSQAEHIHRWAATWAAQGGRAAVDCLGPTAAARWAVLTGLAPYRHGQRVEVLVVDQADRRSSPDLLRLAGAAERSRCTLVLVEGGTMPRLTNFASHGLMRFAEERGRLQCAPAAVWAGPAATPHLPPPAHLAGRPAAEAILREWADDHRAALLVGLGLEEVQALNMAARRLRNPSTGQPDRPAAAGSNPGFRAGDRVVVVRHREGLPPYGTFGDVIATRGDGRTMSVRWSGHERPATLTGGSLAGVRHGWAVTAHMAARLGRPVFLLGAPDAVPRLRGLVVAGIDTPGGQRSIALER